MPILLIFVTLLTCAFPIDGLKKEKIDCVGNKICTCQIIQHGRTMQCHGNDSMNTIPWLSKNISTLIITYGNFVHITKETFAALANSSVKNIRMTICRITTMTSDAFFNLRQLTEIDLSQNTKLEVLSVARSLKSLENSPTIITLIFNRMHWKSLPEDMFAGLVNTSINQIQLAHNYFTNINSSIFSKLSTLRVLNLGWTGLSNKGCNFTGLSQIETLNLTGTWFYRFPNFCDNQNRTVVPNLKYLYLDESKIDSISNYIKCLDSLTKLSLSGLSLRILYPNTFSGLKSLQYLNLGNLGSQFRRVSVHALNSSTLTHLIFSVNEKQFFIDSNNRNFNASKLFKFCPQLNKLDLSKNIFSLSDKTWNKMLSPLQKLTFLKLKDTKIKYIPKIDKTLPNLRELDLSNNRISSWNTAIHKNPFSDFRALDSLIMKDNFISLINKTSFPEKWMNGTGTLRHLFLQGNPFSCSCKISWFRDWMDTTIKRNITTDADRWKCSISQDELKRYHPEKTFECLMPYIITAVLTFIFILLFAFLCYVFRFKIKLALYRCTSRKNDYTVLRDIDFEYDSFIAYSYKDLWWIQEHAIPQLEEKHNRDLCIRDRDFQLGTVFSNAIFKSIRASRSVLFLLTDNFAKDKWCRFQLDIANFINICESNMIQFIPVLLHKEISFRNMNEALFQMIKRGDCLQWQQGGSEEKLFWVSILDRIPKGVNSLDTNLSDESIELFDSGKVDVNI